MAGTTHQSMLTCDDTCPAAAPARTLSTRGPVAFRLAEARDDHAIRRLLRQPMDGRIRIAMPCEPSYHRAAAVASDRHHTAVACHDRRGRILAMGSRIVRTLWIGGRPQRVGYLAHLRRDRDFAGGRHLLAEGFNCLAQTRRSDELPFDLTAIFTDNALARRLLERQLPGMPRYRPLFNYTTHAIRAGRRRRLPRGIRVARDADLPQLIDLLDRFARRHTFAPHWSAFAADAWRDTPGLRADRFMLAERAGRLVGCLARWDQRASRQTIVDSYSPRLTRARPALNTLAAFLGQPALPPPGRPIAMSYLAGLALDDDDSACIRGLIDAQRAAALTDEQPTNTLILGLPDPHPLAPTLRRIPARRMHSTIYAVAHGRADDDCDALLDPHPPFIEAALL